MNGFLAQEHASDDDDVNVKGSYVNCWEHAPRPRELSKTPNVPPLPRAAERDGGI
ncbi:Hypothetical protein A7982_07515 [Minicystis rosea]|nr:Hypothetical protein A7982_07515 [Minicystis rosea]